MQPLMYSGDWLPVVFAALMGLSILIYVILDGYDLGVGILLYAGSDAQKDQMIASIGPFWDANGTWLVLGVGILLVAFPVAHGKILTALYLPTAIMLISLILRGVSFDFRAKARMHHKHRWDTAFFIGSLLAALAQGYMLGVYIMGFESSLPAHLFGLLAGICLAAGYSFVGASWLIMKAEGDLQRKAIRWAQVSLWLTALGIMVVSVTTPLISSRIFDKWFSLPNLVLLAPIPLVTGAIILAIALLLKKMPLANDNLCWAPFAGAVAIFILCFHGLAYSFYPYIIPERMTIWDAASAHESLRIILAGVVVVLPCIISYTIFAYRVFWGKLRRLSYY